MSIQQLNEPQISSKPKPTLKLPRPNSGSIKFHHSRSLSQTATATKQAEYFQGLYKSKLGIDIRIDVQTFKQRLAKMTAGDFDIVGAGWGPDFDDIMTFGDPLRAGTSTTGVDITIPSMTQRFGLP